MTTTTAPRLRDLFPLDVLRNIFAFDPTYRDALRQILVVDPLEFKSAVFHQWKSRFLRCCRNDLARRKFDFLLTSLADHVFLYHDLDHDHDNSAPPFPQNILVYDKSLFLYYTNGQNNPAAFIERMTEEQEFNLYFFDRGLSETTVCFDFAGKYFNFGGHVFTKLEYYDRYLRLDEEDDPRTHKIEILFDTNEEFYIMQTSWWQMQHTFAALPLLS